MAELVPAATPEHVPAVRAIFKEYERWLGFDICFQDFAAELAGLPGDYAPPRGRLYLARCGDAIAGCVGLRPFGSRDCEMKRLFVRPGFRGHGLGRLLTETVVADARTIGFRAMLLDTVPWMTAALALYRSLGFVESDSYRENPVPGARFFRLELGTLRVDSPGGRE